MEKSAQAVRNILALMLFTFCLVSCVAVIKKPAYSVPIDSLIQLRGADGFSGGAFEGTVLDEAKGTVHLASDEKTGAYAVQGRYTTAAMMADFTIREVIPSWNILTPAGTAYLVELRISSDGSSWSPWFHMGRWGSKIPGAKPEKKVLKNEWGAVKVDYFSPQKDCRFLQWRVTFHSVKGKGTPAMALFSCAVSSESGDRGISLRRPPEKKIDKALWKKTLPVPYRSQGSEDSSIAGEICSPTSISMVMDYWGVKKATADMARLIYDPDYKMYGMWWRGVQGASQYGLEGWVQYFRNWEDVKSWIAAGQPVIACISFDAGTLGGSMTPASDGHVIVIAGFDEKGNPVCNDPAGKDEESGIVAYDSGELAKAWFDKGGVGYIIRPAKSPR